jgi:hypothetical protein
VVKTDELVAINNKLTQEDRLTLLTMWSASIIVHAPELPNHSGELNEEVPVCLNGSALQINMREGG